MCSITVIPGICSLKCHYYHNPQIFVSSGLVTKGSLLGNTFMDKFLEFHLIAQCKTQKLNCE